MKCVLIVEDDKEIAAIERDYLEINHIQAEIASDGGMAMEMMKSKRYDLLLLDVMMPFKDGFQLCKEIRNTYDVPILMVTAKTESVDRIRGLGIGADDYILKPFDPAELVARVKAHLARYDRLTGGSKDWVALPKETEKDIAIEDLYIVPKGYKVYVRGEEVKLTIVSKHKVNF
ncbi:response regulator transcription factor [Alkalihalobacillus clausii]|uniref:response regulator transcription factor n=1 Tax=Shouchella clausii TaxID=79880 RepID=UPI00203EAD6A|nr:response regulator transcription factor [Shouchella clausii]MCM3548961.1 response regulator transcription factor [Shouchella clausii]